MLLWLFAALTGLSAAGPAKPNIVFILADDLGYMDIGAFNPKTFYETPNIDSLAQRGMKFTQGYAACCVCSPTRGSIMTGKYPPRFRVTNFIGGSRSGKLLPAPNADHLLLEETTIAESLRAAGYATFFAGKWHLGGNEFYPGAQGFPKELDNGAGKKGNAQFWYPVSELPVPDHKDDPKTTERIVNEAVKLFWHYPHYSNQGGSPYGAIRDGDWKLIEWYEDGALELYNIPQDVAEKNNLAAQHPDKVKELHPKLIAWRQEVGALMPAPNPNTAPAENPNKKKKEQ